MGQWGSCPHPTHRALGPGASQLSILQIIQTERAYEWVCLRGCVGVCVSLCAPLPTHMSSTKPPNYLHRPHGEALRERVQRMHRWKWGADVKKKGNGWGRVKKLLSVKGVGGENGKWYNYRVQMAERETDRSNASLDGEQKKRADQGHASFFGGKTISCFSQAPIQTLAIRVSCIKALIMMAIWDFDKASVKIKLIKCVNCQTLNGPTKWTSNRICSRK